MLDVTRVVMFKHGVGYFQRTGKVDGNASIELDFRESQMNDVLKSLTVLDFGGGAFSTLSYESEEPVEKRLEELNLKIPQKAAFSSFLDQLKGTRVEVPLGNEFIEGQVIGIEFVDKMGSSGKVTEPHLAVLTGGERLMRVPLLEVTEVRFLDESIRRDMQMLLDVLGASLQKDRKRLTIKAVGEGPREVMVSYVVETPVWKTSYRIMLPDDGNDKPLLQGWALVDNTTEDDWKEVRLSLVAGLPISFIHDLYTPRYRRRPVVRVEREAAVAPPVVEKSLAVQESREEGLVMSEKLDFELEDYGDEDLVHERPLPLAKRARASVDVQVHTQDVGDLFAYEITRPVDIARGESALVPILQAEPEAERVALYNSQVRHKNPMTAFRLKNTTGLTLEGGPATVFEGKDYVGEAMLQTLRPDEECITPYSVELGVHVETEQDVVDKGYTRVTRSGTMILVHFMRLFELHYRIHSRLDRPLTLYLDHARADGLKLEDTSEPVEKTENFWRFRIHLDKGEEKIFTVKELGESCTRTSIGESASLSIRKIGASNLLPQRARAGMDKIAAIVEEIESLEREMSKIESDRIQIEEGQERLRKNLKALGDNTEEAELRKRYVNQLSAEEDQLAQLKDKYSATRKKIVALKKKLDAAIEALELHEE